MTCHQIIIKLLVYRLQLFNILSFSEQTEFALDVTNQYSFITIEIIKSGKAFGQVRFELTDQAGKLSSLYCEDNSLKKIIADKIELENWPGWTSLSSIDMPYPHQVLQSMQTADSIAALAKNCARGDDYHPGHFSKISVTSNRIKLEQINHMNAKSLSHKNDYSLRNLVFSIPLDSNPANERSLQKYQIGMMTVEFSDHSSENNKSCGEKIIAELERLAR
jgi:hypothetical protein